MKFAEFKYLEKNQLYGTSTNRCKNWWHIFPYMVYSLSYRIPNRFAYCTMTEFLFLTVLSRVGLLVQELGASHAYLVKDCLC